MTETKGNENSALWSTKIVQVLKLYGKKAQAAYPELTALSQDFEPTDHRYVLSRQLSELIATNCLTAESKESLYFAIAEEIKSSYNTDSLKSEANAFLSIKQWCKIRDGLADIWGWWVEEYLLYCKPLEQSQTKSEIPYIIQLLKLGLPSDYGVSLHEIDSRLGETFFFLCIVVHHLILKQESLDLSMWLVDSNAYYKSRKYQTTIQIDDISLVKFAPTGQDISQFPYLCSRINAARARIDKPFPSFTYMASVDLSSANLNLVNFRGANLSKANLSQADFYGANLSQANLSHANLSHVSLNKVNLVQANLSKANLTEVDLSEANLNGADLHQVNLSHLLLIGTKLIKANLSQADLYGAILCRAVLNQANLSNANLNGANLCDASLIEANLSQANLNYSSLDRANLREALLMGTNMSSAHLEQANLDAIQWDCKTNFSDIVGLESAVDVPIDLRKYFD